MNALHVIYGLYLADRPDAILYVGSWHVATLNDRLRQHQNGECRTTRKMAARNGAEMSALRMRVLRYWMSGAERSPEGEMTEALRGAGQCRWNAPYTFTSEDSRKPKSARHRAALAAAHIGRKLSAEHRAAVSAGLMGRKLSAQHRARLSVVRKGKIKPAEHRTALSIALMGHSVSAEARAKMSAAHIGIGKGSLWPQARRQVQRKGTLSQERNAVARRHRRQLVRGLT